MAECSNEQQMMGNPVTPVSHSHASISNDTDTVSHPIDEVNEENLYRRSLMLEYRAYLARPIEVEIAAERLLIQQARKINSSRRPYRHYQCQSPLDK